MKLIPILALISTQALLTLPTSAQEAAKFYADTFPRHALKSMLEADKVMVGKDAALDAKTRELIALGVAAQIPCAYCVYVHNKNARANGATEAQIREAVAAAAHVRHWSTVLNGMAYDFEQFKTEVDAMHRSK